MNAGWQRHRGFRIIALTCLLPVQLAHPANFAPGELKWDIPGVLTAGPTLGTNGLLYGAALSGDVHAWDAATGQLRWTTNVGASVSDEYASLVIGPEGHLYVSTTAGLLALDGETARVLWSVPGNGAVAVGGDGTVYLSASPLRALDPANGATRWSLHAATPYLRLALGANGLLFALGGGTVSAFRTTTGDPVWYHNEPFTELGSLALAEDGTLIVGTPQGHLLAFESGSGHLLWRVQGTGIISDVILGAQGVVYAAHDGTIYFRDPNTGESQRRLLMPGAVATSLALTSDGTLYVATDNNLNSHPQILALNPATGETNWMFEHDDYARFIGLNVGNDGALYVRSSSLIAIQGTSPLADGPWPKAGQNPQNSGFWRKFGPPEITGQPRSQSVVVNNPVSLHFYTPVMRPLQIQWRKNGAAIPGATNESLVFPYAALSDTGNYSVAVTNEFGGDVSEEAALLVGYNLNISVVGPGFVQRAPDLEVYPPNSVVELTAVTARSNHIFTEWSGDATGTARTVTLTLDRADYAVTATFDFLFPDAKWYTDFSDAAALGTNGALYAYSGIGVMTSLDTITGYTNWQASYFDGWWAPGAIAADGTIYAGDYGGSSVWAFNADTGEKMWGFRVDVCVHACPAIGVDGTLYLSGLKLYAVDPVTHAEKWSFQGGSIFESSPAISADAVVYAGCFDSKMYALNALAGAKLWEFRTGGAIYSSPALGADGTVYFGSLDGKVYAVHGTTGQKRWEFPTGDAVGASAVIGPDGTVYIGSLDNKVYALDGATGALKWAFNAGGQVRATGALTEDGTLYVSSLSGALYALQTETGRKLWEIPGVDGSPAIGPDGTIYCGGFALHGSSPLANSPWPKFHRDNFNRGRAHARPIFDPTRTRKLADALELTIHSEPGERLHLQSSADLLTWEPRGTFTNDTGTLQILEPLPSTTLFYRASTTE